MPSSIRGYEHTVRLDSGLILVPGAASGLFMVADAEGNATWKGLNTPIEPNENRKQGLAITPSTTHPTNVYINVQGNAEAWAFKVEVLVDGNTVANETAKGPGTSQYAFALMVAVKVGGTYEVKITETTGKVSPVGEFRTTYQRAN